jgi:hypothetical protein
VTDFKVGADGGCASAFTSIALLTQIPLVDAVELNVLLEPIVGLLLYCDAAAVPTVLCWLFHAIVLEKEPSVSPAAPL